MSKKEVERITVMEDLKVKKIKQSHAATLLGISVRQVQRVLADYQKLGALGLAHKSRGKSSNRALKVIQKERIKTIIKTHYADFGPTFACEKLAEIHNLTYSDETVRKVMIESGLWVAKRRKGVKLHPYRERRSCFGELVQLDGSPHHWFESRADSCTLLAFIDDATSQILDGAFVCYEGTFPLFEATEHYLNTHGKMVDLYVDRHSTYKVNRQATIEEELKDSQAKTQFSRAMEELGIGLIFALSPQAKGRIERLFETLQDRLVKELRLANISDKQKATKFFREVYIPKHNTRFGVKAKDPTNLHRALNMTDDLKRIFTLKSQRIVSKDLVIQYKNQRYQFEVKEMVNGGYRYSLPNSKVIIEENQQKGITIWYKNQSLPFKTIGNAKIQPQVVKLASGKEIIERRVVLPADNHPWRKSYKGM